jgi:hypothetical protein
MATSTLRPHADTQPNLDHVQQEQVGLSAPRHLLTGLLCLIAGGGVGVGAVSHGVSRPELDQAIQQSAEVARQYTDTSGQRMRDERKAEQLAVTALAAEQMRSLVLGAVRVESKVDQLAVDVQGLKLDVAILKSRGGK